LKRLREWAVACTLFLALLCAARADQYDALRVYWQNYLITNGGSLSSIANNANSYWSSMNTNSTTALWSDLPLGSVSANIPSTYSRLQAMALAWAAPGSSLQNNVDLANAVANGLDWMNTHVYNTTATEYDNWFHWEISGPQDLNNTVVLLYSALTSTEISNYLAAVDRFSPGGPGAHFGWMTGANTSDKVLVVAMRGIIGKAPDKITSAQTNLSPVFLYVTSSDGFYVDGSFVFHGNIAYTGHYGLVLLGDIPKIVNLFQGSAWQITDPNLTNVTSWAISSFEPLIYNANMMDMVRGRAVSWSYETESGDGSSALSAMAQIAAFSPPASGLAISNFISSPRLASGQIHFASMDRVVAIRTNFAFGISMSSSRIANYESINSGNLHGWFQGDGMTYLYQGSGEKQFSSDFWPTVDPYHLPGTTVETNSHANSAGEAQTTDQNWVGGAQVANTYGVAGMSMHSWNTTLFGKKSWFMFDNEIICLGAGITCGGPAEVHTTAENRRLGTSLTNTFILNGQAITPTIGWSSNLPSATPSWIFLGGYGGYYFPAGSSNLQATFTANSGSWSQINSGDSSTANTDDYLKLWFNHGLMPTNSGYAYVLLPTMTSTSVSNYANTPDIVILTNSTFLQAVKKPSLGVVAANFWTNGNSSVDMISVSDKASVITLEGSNTLQAGISDPTQTNKGVITVTLNRSAAAVASADPAITVLQLSPQIILSVNVNGSHGKSFQAALTYSNSILPALSNVYPDGSTPMQSTNTLSFVATSSVGLTNVTVTVNGVIVSNLVFSGSSNNWLVTYSHLLPNQLYTAVITITDANGNQASATESFDTFSVANFTWEAEDYDYSGGQFIATPQTNGYAGRSAFTNVDSLQVKFGGTELYRPSGMDTEVNGDVLRPAYNGTGKTDYSLGYFGAGAWANYTRVYPAGSYNVYARLAAGSGATTCTLYQVTGGWGTTSQTTNLLGTFTVPNTAWETYNYIPLKDNGGNFVTVTFNGSTNTLRLARPSSATADCNANFLMLTPVLNVSAVANGTNTTLSFLTQAGFNYQIQYKTNLTDTDWIPVGAPVSGNGAMQSTDVPNGNPSGFYRVQLQ
jgi:hyaluronate lyase